MGVLSVWLGGKLDGKFAIQKFLFELGLKRLGVIFGEKLFKASFLGNYLRVGSMLEMFGLILIPS